MRRRPGAGLSSGLHWSSLPDLPIRERNGAHTAKKEKWSVVALDLGIDTSTVNGRLVANIVMSVAEWEREIISQRTVEALAEARDAGVKLGRPIL
ncbi:MAG: recombinase family protein, partial [Aldersonia sp.]|nr:recombinase family protein [Aldersonia sp.]